MLRRSLLALLFVVSLSGCQQLMGAATGWSRPVGDNTAVAAGSECRSSEPCSQAAVSR